MTTQEKRTQRGKAMRIFKHSAFDHYEFMGFNDPDMRPDAGSCEGCPQWDYINGCWDNCRSIMQCTRMGEEPYYNSSDFGDYEEDYLSD